MSIPTRPVLDRIFTVENVLRSWEEGEQKARESAQGQLSSFIIEDLMTVAGREMPAGIVRRVWNEKIEPLVVRSEANGIVPVSVKNEEELTAILDELQEMFTERFMSWYRPNSTSNAHVEIMLREHEANQDMMKALSGRRF